MSEKIRKKIELIYQSMLFKLHDDPWLRLDDLNKVDAMIDDGINGINGINGIGFLKKG